MIDFARAIKSAPTGADSARPARLIGPDGHEREIPPELFAVLELVADTLARGNGVTVVPNQATLTTQEAADFLGVSRPTLVKYLEGGRIPFTHVGRHRRVELSDVLAFQESERTRIRQSLTEMTAIAQAEGMEPDFDPRQLNRLDELDG